MQEDVPECPLLGNVQSLAALVCQCDVNTLLVNERKTLSKVTQ